MAWQNFPMITCPHCHEEVQIDDEYRLETGDSFGCVKCGKAIYIWATDITYSGDLHKRPEITMASD